MAEFQVSTEEFIKNFNCDDPIHDLLALDSTLPSQINHQPSGNTCIPYVGTSLIDPDDYNIGKDEFNIYFPTSQKSKGDIFDPSDHLFFDNELFPQHTPPKVEPTIQPGYVILSQSVDVTLPKKSENTSGPIQIVHELEVDYKPRYKSDYHSQEGKIRPPRYVADRLNNHFVSIRVIQGLKGYIRIDWVTVPDKQKVRYVMPYKFQVNNDSIDVPDRNPIYEEIKPETSGIMKLYVVLIKSKQSELLHAQPLQPFSHVPKGVLVETNRLSPKQLIQQFKLDQSQLAFTYCRPGLDPTTCIPDWSTTVYSTVMTERPDEAAKKRKVTCPNCECSFQITVDIADDGAQESIIKRPKT